jgi:predicted metal-dependent phosphoesterase TrpH
MDGLQTETGKKSEKLKVDLHVHTASDPDDNLPLDIESTIELAGAQGYDAIALTHHDAYFHITDDIARIAERAGVIVLPGIEASLDDGAHVLVINCGPEIEGIASLKELAKIRRPEHLIVPAHPFYPSHRSGAPVLSMLRPGARKTRTVVRSIRCGRVVVLLEQTFFQAEP